MAHVNERVHKYRQGLRESGLRPVQIWVPDTRRDDFAAEARRQAQRVAQARHADPRLEDDLDAAAGDVEGWTE